MDLDAVIASVDANIAQLVASGAMLDARLTRSRLDADVAKQHSISRFTKLYAYKSLAFGWYVFKNAASRNESMRRLEGKASLDRRVDLSRDELRTCDRNGGHDAFVASLESLLEGKLEIKQMASPKRATGY